MHGIRVGQCQRVRRWPTGNQHTGGIKEKKKVNRDKNTDKHGKCTRL